jgi:hypothetical protein
VDHTIDQLFGIRTEEPISLQVVGDPALGTAGPFAMLLRYPVQLGEVAQRDLTTIGGWTVGVITYPNGNGDALWNLPDGGQGYLRSRDLTLDQIVGVIASLEPRPPDAAIPGFDLAASAALPLIAEHMNSGIDARGAAFTCQTNDEHPLQYRVDAWDGEPVFEFLAILDRARPLDAGNIDGTTIVIASGIATETSPRVAQVTNADQGTWDTLLRQPSG